ncbi:MAG: hypothetical protein ACOY0T_37085 [Myxococcota bacterium]
MSSRLRVWMFFACAGMAPACFQTTVIEVSGKEDTGGKGGSSGGTQALGGTGGIGAAGRGGAPLGEGGSSSGGKSASGGTSSGGKGGNSALGGNTALGGNAAVGGSTALGGSAALGGKAAFGGSGGQPTSGVTWLSFDQNRAPAALAPNSELGIDGVLYGYGDSCASITFDNETRCATGSLCEPGANFANWGVAIGFDFRNTGETGTPPNAKRTWNPTEFGVRGVAWEITGTAPALQLWVLNMDPIHQGECDPNTTTQCDIAGPPDGTSTPGLVDQLLFSNMRKDDWGGSGVRYTFDPAAVHALQFKLPAIIAGAANFSFCVKRVGLIR